MSKFDCHTSQIPFEKESRQDLLARLLQDSQNYAHDEEEEEEE